jgi:hypothetical protein
LAGFHSDVPVFVDASQVRSMTRVIAAVQAVVDLPAYRQAVTRDAPRIAGSERPTLGAFTGFDFHISGDEPRLIEINTNAGGAMINATAEWRHPDCCVSHPGVRQPPGRDSLEAQFVAMFQQEWRLARGARPLGSIAIVDDSPGTQFLFPEFELFADLLRRHGFLAFIADAGELDYANGRLSHRGRQIDLVYNRLTDFYLEDAAHGALRAAFEDDAAVITPHPRAHALLADKGNLVRFTDAEFLRAAGADEADIATLLAHVPRTERVSGCDEGRWQERKSWFFKPTQGFGSRGAYRGDKLTRRVFGELLKGGYVAQRLAAPGQRVRKTDAGLEQFKVDVRVYAYDGRPQLMAARLYQGQVTNFRTLGGGFAPVLELGDV